MVNTEIPKHYTASPSSYTGTPLLTINREVTADIDSSNAFEGPEKLLEVWFGSSPKNLPPGAVPGGLKVVPADVWKEMLDLVNCKVLSIVESEHVDAYLLSESSMFVFPHKLILKTCGTTTLLWGLPRILEIAASLAGFPRTNGLTGSGDEDKAMAATPYRVFYSRKNFLFPDRQRGPHRSWRDEVRSLDRLFVRGSAYMIGKMNGDHWYLYITEPNSMLTPPATPPGIRPETEIQHLDLPAETANALCSGYASGADETLEILMTDLAPETCRQYYLDNASAVAEGRYYQQARRARKQAAQSLGTIDESRTTDTFDVFEQTSSDHAGMSSDDEEVLPVDLTTEGHALGTVVSDTTGLSEVYPSSKYPDAKIDAYLFTPCGFSANGVIPAPATTDGQSPIDTHYFTVHVTPEVGYSYASFETNVPARAVGRETAEVVQQVVDIFKPGRFSVTLFETKSITDDDHGLKTVKRTDGIDGIVGYRRLDRIVHDLDGYDLVFRYYERNDWAGGEPRVGEF